MANARAYAEYTWQVKGTNANSIYNHFKEDQWVTGVAYNSGGVDSIPEFKRKISEGKIAGNVYPSKGILWNNSAGIDCTGFIQQVWEAREDCFQVYIRNGTSREICESNPMKCKCEPVPYLLSPQQRPIGWDKLKPGDMTFRPAPKHARLFAGATGDNRMWVVESTTDLYEGVEGRVNHRILSRDNHYSPYPYKKIEDDTKPLPLGGLDVKKYCQQRGYSKPYVNPQDPNSWTCKNPPSCAWSSYDTSRDSLSVNYACREQYNNSCYALFLSSVGAGCV